MNEIKDLEIDSGIKDIYDKVREYRCIKLKYEELRGYIDEIGQPDAYTTHKAYDPEVPYYRRDRYGCHVLTSFHQYVCDHKDKIVLDEADRLFVTSVELEKEISRMIEEFKHG